MRNSVRVTESGRSIASEHGWRDELTELHVLAHNGDAEAAATAARWCATEPRVRQLWDEVERTCAEVADSGER